MTAMLGGLQLGLLAFLLFTLLGSSLAAVLEPVIAKRLRQVDPRAQGRALLAFMTAPALLAVACTVACFAPGLLSSFDHCLGHGGHPHLCLSHLPDHAGSLPGWALIAIAGVALADRVVTGTRALLRAGELLRSLEASAVPGQRTGTYEIEQAAPFCLSAGFFRPRVLVSTGLLQGIQAAQLEAILAHERAHARRRDALLLAVARAFSVFHWPSVARRLLSDLELACERSCDEAAAAHVGDRVTVADAIVCVERLLKGRSQPAAAGIASFGQHGLEARVRALLDEPRRGTIVPGGFAILSALMLLPLVCAVPLHHATEVLLTTLNH